MNNRIKELLEQSTEVYDNWYSGKSVCMVDYNMFAELLIRECVDVVLMSSDRHRKEYFAGLIKQHFGVQP